MARSIRDPLALALSALLLAASAASTSGGKEQDKGKDEEQPFQKLVNRNSEKVAAVFGKDTKNGAKCVQLEFAPDEKSQQWRVIKGSGGFSYIENANSKTMLSVKLAYKNQRVGKKLVKVVSGGDVCIAEKVPTDPSQMWKMQEVGGKGNEGYFVLVNRATNTALAVEGSSSNKNAKLVLAAPVRGAKSQQWKFDKLAE